ncbi:MAG: putative manganese transporter [Bacteroidales bacterium]|nr:putative manganese transporter [Bacteroidales bacterium]
MIADILIDSLRTAILITGMVVVMMLMIESTNILSRGRWFSSLGKSSFGQIVLSALLGSIPGCMGGFASVSLYSHGMISFGALVAMMIATSGDESFVMLGMFPGTALKITAILFVIAVVAGWLVDRLSGGKGRVSAALCHEMAIHDEDEPAEHTHTKRHLNWKRVVLFIGLAVYAAALAFGMLEHEHEGGEEIEMSVTSGLLDEAWMNIMFACLSVIMLGVIVFASDHFIDEHLWHHIVCTHLPKVFAWTFGILLLLAVGNAYLDVESWVSSNIPLMILLASLIGIIPESGPHLIFVTMFATGAVPVSVLMASCISQDGHAALPLFAESKKAFLYAKAINFLLALAVGFAIYGFSLL